MEKIVHYMVEDKILNSFLLRAIKEGREDKQLPGEGGHRLIEGGGYPQLIYYIHRDAFSGNLAQEPNRGREVSIQEFFQICTVRRLPIKIGNETVKFFEDFIQIGEHLVSHKAVKEIYERCSE